MFEVSLNCHNYTILSVFIFKKYYFKYVEFYITINYCFPNFGDIKLNCILFVINNSLQLSKKN